MFIQKNTSMFKARQPYQPLMTEDRYLDSGQAREIEEELFATRRQQSSRHVPVPLPRQDFWEMVGKLLSDIDMDIQHMMMNGMTGIRLQNLQKRQANVRRIASELARKRLVSMMQHVASQSLRIAAQPGMIQDLAPLDWQRHDPAEKAFYHGLQIQMDRFKKDIDWNSMQKGELSENLIERVTHSPGTMQLDSFVEHDKNLTGNPPPDLIFEDDETQQEIVEELDEEDRFLDEQWPDMEDFIPEELTESVTVKSIESTENEQLSTNKHSAAMELAPSKNSGNKIILDGLGDSEQSEKEEKLDSIPNGELVRIKVIESFPEPVMVGSGEEILLEKDDVHFLDQETADWLVESGVAEVESL
tara:strand:- start:622 stop:1698 length:1077 start_codon:yes stop_codon:yes gene_type:complete